MTVETQNHFAKVIELLKAGLWGASADVSMMENLTLDDWQSIRNIACQQTVSAIVLKGIESLPSRLLPSDNELMKWVVDADRIERTNKHVNEVMHRLIGLFKSRKLNPVVMKGQGIAQCYIHPLTRQSGDIDFYFGDKSSIEIAVSLLSDIGLQTKTHSDDSISAICDGVEIELHQELIEISNPQKRRYIKSLLVSEQWSHVAVELPNNMGCSISVPSPITNLLMINVHILKHAIGNGVGLRQLCDMARLHAEVHNKVDAAELRGLYKKMGLERWSKMLYQYLIAELGMDESFSPYDTKEIDIEPLRKIIINGGNFGHFAKHSRLKSNTAIQRKLSTAKAFTQKITFSMHYAPSFTFWTIFNLAKGQLKSQDA